MEVAVTVTPPLIFRVPVMGVAVAIPVPTVTTANAAQVAKCDFILPPRFFFVSSQEICPMGSRISTLEYSTPKSTR
jgi:hypothetical protein